MLNKKLVVIFLMTIFISACGNNKEFKMTNKNTRIYHLAAVDIVPVIGPILSPFNPHTIRYVGKLEVDEETKGIKYYFLNLADEKRLSSVFTLYKNEEERLFYIDYSNKKLTKISESEEIDYMQYMNLWVRTGEVTFSDPNFWNIFEKYGIKTKISNTQTVTYRVINSKVGEELYKNKNEAVGTEILREALKLNFEEYFAKESEIPSQEVVERLFEKTDIRVEQSPNDISVTLNK